MPALFFPLRAEVESGLDSDQMLGLLHIAVVNPLAFTHASANVERAETVIGVCSWRWACLPSTNSGRLRTRIVVLVVDDRFDGHYALDDFIVHMRDGLDPLCDKRLKCRLEKMQWRKTYLFARSSLLSRYCCELFSSAS